MSRKPSTAENRRIEPPQRVRILRTGEVVRSSSYWKPGQFGYVHAINMTGGMHCGDKAGSKPGDWDSKPGEAAYLVSKSKDMRGGATWFSAAGIQFTSGGRAKR